MSLDEITEALRSRNLDARSVRIAPEDLPCDCVAIVHLRDDRSVDAKIRSGHFIVAISHCDNGVPALTLLEPTTASVLVGIERDSVFDKASGYATVVLPELHEGNGWSGQLTLPTLVAATAGLITAASLRRCMIR